MLLACGLDLLIIYSTIWLTSSIIDRKKEFKDVKNLNFMNSQGVSDGRNEWPAKGFLFYFYSLFQV